MKREIKDKMKNGSDFLRYSESRMTESERNAFEKELQKDPFAAEAEEGFDLVSPDEAKNDLSDLGIRLKKRTANKRRLTYYYSIAASVAVLMILSSVWLFVSRDKPASPAEKVLQEISNLDIPQSEKIAEPAPAPVQVAGQKASERKGQTEAVDKSNTARQVAPALAKASEPEIEAQAEADQPAAVKVEETQTPQSSDISKAAGAPMAMGAVKKEARAEEVVSGISDSARDIVSFSYDSSDNKAMRRVVTTPAEPQTGKEQFDKYAEENIRVPADQKAGDEKVVVIEFIVKETGEFGAFRIIRSPSKEYSTEAERLIREGPAWKPAILSGNSVESKVRLKIAFKRN